MSHKIVKPSKNQIQNKDHVWFYLGRIIGNSTRLHHWVHVGDLVWDQVERKVIDQVWEQIASKAKEQVIFQAVKEDVR